MFRGLEALTARGIPYGFGLMAYDAAAVSDATANPGGGESLTQQHFADEVDIENIVRRFGLTGQLPTSAAAAKAVYGDFTGIEDYQSAIDRVAEIGARFHSLPAQFREQFKNDPGELVSFASKHSEEELEAVFGRAIAPAEPVAPAAPAPVAPVVGDQPA